MKNRRKSIRGQSIIEYAIIIVIVAITALTVLYAFGNRLVHIVSDTVLSLSDREYDKTGVDAILTEDGKPTQKIMENMTVHGLKGVDGVCNDGF